MNKTLDITKFDAVAESEGGFDLKIKDTDGITDTGIVLTIIGKHADAVMAWSKKHLNAYIRDNEMAKRRGKEPEIKSIEELREQNLEGTCVRVTGWKNVKQEFSQELLKSALLRNPNWVEQIIEASDDAGNFTKAS